MRKILMAGLAIIALCASIAFAALRNDALVLDALAWRTPDVSLADHSERLAPHIRVEAEPEGASDARLPAFVIFHGCSGYNPPLAAFWGESAAAAGWRALSVDSHAPRGISPETARTEVCAGKRLLGQERAADVLAALRIVAARPDVEPAKVVVAGWSHGAWTIMDLFAMDLAHRSPAGLSERNIPAPGIAGAALFYPYCGRGAWSRAQDWTIAPATIAFIAGSDTVVDGPACRSLLEGMAERGADIDVVYYPDADHVFDNEAAPQYYDAASRADAAERLESFLRSLN